MGDSEKPKYLQRLITLADVKRVKSRTFSNKAIDVIDWEKRFIGGFEFFIMFYSVPYSEPGLGKWLEYRLCVYQGQQELTDIIVGDPKMKIGNNE